VIAPQRVTLSSTTTKAIRQLALKTGLTPNIVARFAILVSLEEPDCPAADSGEVELTINRASLFGELEPFLLTALLASESGSSEKQLSKTTAAHIARGARLLLSQANSIVDLVELAIQ
jgi:DNA sulfur modification protein DndE